MSSPNEPSSESNTTERRPALEMLGKEPPEEAQKQSESTTAATSSNSSNNSSSLVEGDVDGGTRQSGNDDAIRDAANCGTSFEERPGSPIQHRRIRGIQPLALDLNSGNGMGNSSSHKNPRRGDSSAPPLDDGHGLIPTMMVAITEGTVPPPPTQQQQQQQSQQPPPSVSYSLPNSDSDNFDIHGGENGRWSSAGVGRRDAAEAARDPTAKQQGSDIDAGTTADAAAAAAAAAEEQEEEDEERAAAGVRSPEPVTLLGVNNDLRRKRIKKVSNYVLGPLLGEGVYGVVRDALDLSGERVTRCAVKMMAGGGGGGASASNGSPKNMSTLGEATRAAFVSQEELCTDENAAAVVVVPPTPTAADGGNSSMSANGDGQNRDDTKGSAGPALHIGRRSRGQGPFSGSSGGGGLKRCSRDTLLSQVLAAESVNLQRFHNKHIIRAMDIFSRNGKQYVVLPIAICSLEQLIVETQQSIAMEQQQEQAREGAATPHAVSQGKHKGRTAEHKNSGGSPPRASRPAISIINVGESFPEDDDDDEGNEHSFNATSSSSSATTRTIDSYNDGSARKRHVNSNNNSNSGNTPAAACARPASLLPAMLIKGIMFQVFSGLAYLHKQNLAHNDIKPSNILLFESGTVKLTDLGSVSERFEDRGTPLYASPELCQSFFLVANTSNAHKSNTASSSSSSSVKSCNGGGGGEDVEVDAKKCDMWCCGLVLYYLITGKVGPLPVHVEVDRLMKEADEREAATHRVGGQYPYSASSSHDRGGGAHVDPHTVSSASRLLTRFQVYREIGSQKTAVELDQLPDLIIDPAGKGGPTTADLVDRAVGGAKNSEDGHHGNPYPPNSVRNLLSQLLEVDPAKRITAVEALAHPWVTLTFKTTDKQKQKHRSQPQAGNGGKPPKQPSREAMEEAIQRDVAKRVLQSCLVKQMIKKDKERHLQFVADVAHILHIDLPQEIFKHTETEPFDEEERDSGGGGGGDNRGRQLLRLRQRETGERSSFSSPDDEEEGRGSNHYNGARGEVSSGSPGTSNSRQTTSAAMAHRGASAVGGSGSSNTAAAAAVEGTVVCSYRPLHMPPGCVDSSLFLPFDEDDYYEAKSGGKKGFDVKAFREVPLKVRAVKEYLYNVVLVQCGYRTAADPAYSIHSIGSNLTSMLRRNQSSNNNLPPLGHTVNSSGSNNNAINNTNSNTGGGNSGGGASTSANTYGNGNEVLPVQPPNASAIMGSVVIQTNRRNSLQARRGLSSSRPGSPAPLGEEGRSGSRNQHRGRSAAAYDGAAGEANTAMKESSKCFCGLV